MQALRSAAVLLAVTTLVAGCSTITSPPSPPATPNDHPQVVVNSLGMGVVAQMPVAADVGSGDERDELGSG